MSNKIITLSGAANEVLYALFFRGALLSGDLPSKSGAAELRELGFAETRHTATEYQKENHFTFLTSEGQKFAVEHLVNTRFGEQQYCASMALGVEIDTSAAQKAIDELDQRIRDTVSFELIRNGV
ncbi:Fur-regulated protein, partial [Citrobacter freundii]